MKPNFYNLKIFLKKIGNMLVVKAPTDYLDFEVKFATILQSMIRRQTGWDQNIRI